MPWPAAAGRPRHATPGCAGWSRRAHAAAPARRVAADVLDPRDPGVLLVARRHPLGTMLGAYNVTDRSAHVAHQVLNDLGMTPGWVVDRISGKAPVSREDAVQLPPYGAVWLTLTP